MGCQRAAGRCTAPRLTKAFFLTVERESNFVFSVAVVSFLFGHGFDRYDFEV
jgi:hypothetical protein